jgi:hypothetical protein
MTLIEFVRSRGVWHDGLGAGPSAAEADKRRRERSEPEPPARAGSTGARPELGCWAATTPVASAASAAADAGSTGRRINAAVATSRTSTSTTTAAYPAALDAGTARPTVRWGHHRREQDVP